jgi:hypothetical protein
LFSAVFYFFAIGNDALALILTVCALLIALVVLMEMLRVKIYSAKRIIGAAFIGFLLLIAARAVRTTNGLLTLQFISVLKIFKTSRIVRMNHASKYSTTLSMDSNAHLNAQILALSMKLVAPLPSIASRHPFQAYEFVCCLVGRLLSCS